tara:strand:- start:2153 stop:4345 length:2193 start_codon:yes stop_codon:yes gene_type:complete
MIISIWRYSHFALALISSLFILVLSITGLILSLEPISNGWNQNPKIAGKYDISLAQLYQNLKSNYTEIYEIELDDNQQLIISAAKEGNEDRFYINPLSGNKTGEIEKKAEIFNFSTKLHRSLFLKFPGRLLIGIFSFLLLLIAISGFILFLQRQKGILNYFKRIKKDNPLSLLHLKLSRVFIIPILLIAFSGVYLSLLRFSIIPNPVDEGLFLEESSSFIPEIPIESFPLFQELKISQITSLKFPFFKDPSEFFQVNLKDKKLLVNQYNGKIEKEVQNSRIDLFSLNMFNIHTGRTSVLWAIILGLSSVSILVFMYSGFAISLRRRSGRIKNQISKTEAEIFIGVGSENGSSLLFAKSLQSALYNHGKKSYIFHLNHIEDFPKMKHLLIFSASYGDGEAPSNANLFLEKLENLNFSKTFKYSVLGFGSLAYSKFCGFAADIEDSLRLKEKAQTDCELFKINNQSFESFRNWTNNWTNKNQFPPLILKDFQSKPLSKEFQTMKLSSKKSIGDLSVLDLSPSQKIRATSGDLLAILAPGEKRARLYSLAVFKEGNLSIALRKHEFGICSQHLSKLNIGDQTQAMLKKNREFHLPKKAKEVLMICNGTGVMPFLGMIENCKPTIKFHLYWGIKNPDSKSLYKEKLDSISQNSGLENFKIAYSQKDERLYVQNLIQKEQGLICKMLKNGATIMICGSISMQADVLKLLQKTSQEGLGKPLSYFENRGQLKMDCY